MSFYSNWSLKLKIAVPIVTLAVIAYGVSTWITVKDSRREAINDAEKLLSKVTAANANDTKALLEKAMTTSRVMAQFLEAERKTGSPDRNRINNNLKNVLSKNKGAIIGAWTGWEVNAFDGKDQQFVGQKGHDKTGRFVPYWNFGSGTEAVEPLSDYDKPGAGDYYLVPQKTGKATLIEPYKYMVGGKEVLMSSAVMPIHEDGKFLGVAGVDFELGNLAEQFKDAAPYPGSEVYIVTQSGSAVIHPDPKKVSEKISFAFKNDEILKSIEEGKAGNFYGVDPKDHKTYAYTLSPVQLSTGSPWSFVIKSPENEFLAGANRLMWSQITVGVCSVFFILVAIWALSHFVAKTVSTAATRLTATEEEINKSLEHLSLSGQSLSGASSTAAASVEETVASLEELAAMVKLNSENAQQAAELSDSSFHLAENGQKEMDHLIGAMNEISSFSQKMEEIINVIDDIAFQTNLLALNAAVEAARAGEQGKGFAVVAEAVRALAQRSASAAKDISSLIQESIDKVQEGRNKANQSGASLVKILEGAKKVAQLNSEIATASADQSTGIGQISSAMNQLDQAIQSNASSSEEIAQVSSEIFNQAQQMKALVEELNRLALGAEQGHSGVSEVAQLPSVKETKTTLKKAA